MALLLLMAEHVPTSHPSSRSGGLKTGASPRGEITIGFVPMVDCAILVAAQELGFFRRHGLSVQLRREVGWATLRDKLLSGELQAAHAPGSLAFVLQAGLGVPARPCLTGFVMSLNGSAITLSSELWGKGVRDAASLGKLIKADRRRTFNFGAVHEYATQHFDLRRWLRSGGIDPERDVQISYVPTPIVHRQLEVGHLDGYCAGEPWNSVAVASGAGWIAATSAEISPAQIEKVLLVLKSFEETRPDEHLALLAALIEASAFCEAPEHRAELVRLLARPAYLGLPEALIAHSLMGPLETGHGARTVEDFIVFQRHAANVPDRTRARHLFDEVRSVGAGREARALRPDIISTLFREDLYRAAERKLPPRQPIPTAGLVRTSPRPDLNDSPLRMAVSG